MIEEGLRNIARTLPCPEDLIKQLDALKGIDKAEQEVNVKDTPVSSFLQMDPNELINKMSDELINKTSIDYKIRICAQENIIEIILTRIKIMCEIIFVEKVILDIIPEIEWEEGESPSSSYNMIQDIETIIWGDDEEDVNRDEMIHNCMQNIGGTRYLAYPFSKIIECNRIILSFS